MTFDSSPENLRFITGAQMVESVLGLSRNHWAIMARQDLRLLDHGGRKWQVCVWAISYRTVWSALVKRSAADAAPDKTRQGPRCKPPAGGSLGRDWHMPHIPNCNTKFSWGALRTSATAQPGWRREMEKKTQVHTLHPYGGTPCLGKIYRGNGKTSCFKKSVCSQYTHVQGASAMQYFQKYEMFGSKGWWKMHFAEGKLC